MNTKIQTSTASLVLAMMFFQILPRVAVAASDEMIYPLKEVSTLDCRFQDFDTLTDNCKEELPVLKTKDYNKYATQNEGYNDYTRRYTVLWGSSYKYGWDVGHGGHQGTDIATAKGTPVYSIADGKILEAGTDIGWGNYVSIEHTIRGKKIVSNYAHLSKILVEKGDSVDIGDKIGEVGSTGNSTGNHLHFQIDLPSVFHPYYYDYTACPYSYYEITEKGVCFDELAKNTFDPFAFLESNGALLDAAKSSSSSPVKTSSASNSSVLPSIFDTTVYYEYGTSSDVKEVQKIMKDLGYYNGAINGDFADLEASIMNYQIKTGVIAEKTDDGAGWFGPKTRVQAKKDYLAYTSKNPTSGTTNTPSVVENTNPAKIETVSRENLMTREEIEAREVQEFLGMYDISFINPISQLAEQETKVSLMQVENAKGRGFKGNSPGNISFVYDESKVSVFPKSFYNFSDGQREISITGKVAGHTTISVKLGDVIVKTFSVTVGKVGATPKVESAKLYTGKQVVVSEGSTGIVLMKDQYGNKMVRTSFSGNYEIKSDTAVKYCIKRGVIEDIISIYKRPCLDEEYSDTLSFTYKDTIGGLLVFDYKVFDKKSINLKLTAISPQKELAKNTIEVQNPKGLTPNYPYYESIVSGLESHVLTGINKGYFLEDRELSARDGVEWIENILKKTPNSTQKLEDIQNETQDKFTSLTRAEFLKLTHTYLSSGGTNPLKEYRDLESPEETMLANIVGNEYDWQDGFGENYFQPDKKITRGEAAYFLTQALETQGKVFLVRK